MLTNPLARRRRQATVTMGAREKEKKAVSVEGSPADGPSTHRCHAGTAAKRIRINAGNLYERRLVLF
jgi:hypothetical protein